MRDSMILMFILNLLVVAIVLFIPIHLIVKGIILGGMGSIILAEYVILRQRKR